ncbi:unnamed protein product, partial [Discosporangium mesarthrocarpum]
AFLSQREKSLLEEMGIKSPAGKHPGYIVTLYGKKTRRCHTCAGCTAMDCGTCRFCKDMPKHGGRGSYKQPCQARRCAWVEYDRRVKGVLNAGSPKTSSLAGGALIEAFKGRVLNNIPGGGQTSPRAGRGTRGG